MSCKERRDEEMGQRSIGERRVEERQKEGWRDLDES